VQITTTSSSWRMYCSSCSSRCRPWLLR
jgi:hypothetical protein